jgi:uncharacterized protein (TIGR04255 family)
MKIDFEKPPINEVSIGMHFAPLSNLKAEQIGLFWSRIRPAFPNSQQTAPIGNVLHLPPEVFPMPRFWFIAKDDATLIQVQKSAFLFNWRLRGESYPRFDSVFDAFRKQRSTFLQFLREDLNTAKIEPAKLQLTYVNLFENVPYWSGPQDTPKIVPSFGFINPGSKVAKPKDFNSTTIFQIEDDLLLSVTVRNGLNNSTGKMVLVLELEASGTHPRFETEKADAWYHRAHIAISESFVALTDRQIQEEYWIRK